MPNYLKTAFPIFRIIVELVVGAYLLLATPAALYSLILNSPDFGELNASALRISLVLALGLGLWKDALQVGKHLRIVRAV